MRFLFVVVLAVVVGTLFFTSRLRETTADRGTVQDFYDKTINGIEDRHSRHPHARPPEANEKESPQHKDKKEKAGQQQRQRVLADKSSPPSKTTDEDKEQEDATEDRDDDGDVDEDDERLAREMKTRLRQAEKAAKDNANAKALKPDPPSEVIGVGNSAAGQPGRAQRKKKVDGAGKEKPTKTEETEDDEDEELESKIETELNSIFKRSPGG